MARISNDDILEMLNGISDQQAFDSDFGGDSDAEDTPCIEKNSYISDTRTTKGSKRKKCNLFTDNNSSTSVQSSSSCSINSCDNSIQSNISPEVPKLSRLRPKLPKSVLDSNLSTLNSSGSEFDDTDFDPSYEPIFNKGVTGNVLVENSDDEPNDALNLSESMNYVIVFFN